MIPQLVDKVICHDRSTQSFNLDSWHTHKRHARVLHYSPESVMQTRIKNRCVLSGRAKGVYRFCKLSRIRIRQYAARGLLVGVTKSSW
ncbi:MAG: 30S ribosomal protein S14 [Sphingobacteriaceae bacterium]|nr:MAG: 30S ribosomal protein S14 [Sphingobacteriaceae bacterium]